MVVNHGTTVSQVVNGQSFTECLAYLSQTDLYKGYGPKLTDMKKLEAMGKLSIGWADYQFFNDKQIEALIA